jgi:hypothetical protein
VNRAELFVEGDALQLLRMFGQRLAGRAVARSPGALMVPLILLPEMTGVGQARGEDFAIAGDDRFAAILRLDIGGADESRSELARAVAQNEIFLVYTEG